MVNVRFSLFAFIVVSVAVCDGVAAQVRILFDRTDRPLSSETAPSPLTEPHVAVSPSDPSHVVVGAIVAPVDSVAPWRCAAFASSDGGDAWARHDFAIDRCIDPWVSFTPGGDVLFIAIELTRGVDTDERFHLLAYRSSDGGRTWSERTSLGTRHEHGMTFAAPEGGGTMYLLSRRMDDRTSTGPRHALSLRRSTDDGRTFAEVAELRPFNRGLTATGLALLADGTLAIGFHDFTDPEGSGASREDRNRFRAWVYRSGPDRIAFGRPPRLITNECGSGATRSLFPGHPAFTGDGAESIYHACVTAEMDDVLVSRSADGGATWEAPVRVAAARGARTVAGTPMLALAPDGTVAVAWYDRRHDPDRACQDFYFTASTDRGRTFAAPVRVSTETSCPRSPGNGRAGRSWAFGGDYTSIAARDDGAFYLVWADSRTGRFALRYAVAVVSTP